MTLLIKDPTVWLQIANKSSLSLTRTVSTDSVDYDSTRTEIDLCCSDCSGDTLLLITGSDCAVLDIPVEIRQPVRGGAPGARYSLGLVTQ